MSTPPKRPLVRVLPLRCPVSLTPALDLACCCPYAAFPTSANQNPRTPGPGLCLAAGTPPLSSVVGEGGSCLVGSDILLVGGQDDTQSPGLDPWRRAHPALPRTAGHRPRSPSAGRGAAPRDTRSVPDTVLMVHHLLHGVLSINGHWEEPSLSSLCFYCSSFCVVHTFAKF